MRSKMDTAVPGVRESDDAWSMRLLRPRGCLCVRFVDNDDSVLSSSSDILSESRGPARLVERARVCRMGLTVWVLVGFSFVVSLYSVLDASESDDDKDAA